MYLWITGDVFWNYRLLSVLLLAAAAIVIHFGLPGWYTVGERGRFAEYWYKESAS